MSILWEKKSKGYAVFLNTMDKSFIKSYEGIKAVNIIDVLLEEQK